MFHQIIIDVDLSADMDSDLPTSGDAETSAINQHAETIEKTMELYLSSIRTDLESLGYLVEIDL